MEQEVDVQAMQRLRQVASAIHTHNLQLIDGLDDPAFDPSLKLDCTLNAAQYKLTDFFDALKCIPYGSDVTAETNDMISSTDGLLQKIVARYGSCPEVRRCAAKAGLAFRHSKRLWRLRSPIASHTAERRAAELDDALQSILDALDALNLAFLQMPGGPMQERANCPPVAPQAGAASRRHRVSIDRMVELLAQACVANNTADRRLTRRTFLRWERGGCAPRAGYSASCRDTMSAAKAWICRYIVEEQERLHPDCAVSYSDTWLRHCRARSN